MKKTDATPPAGDLLALANRKRYQPKPSLVHAARERFRLNKSTAPKIITAGRRTWVGWERGERKMSQTCYELFVILNESAEARAICLRLAKAQK